MLPVEATQQLAEQKLLPSWFGKLNKYHAPSNSLLITQLMIQIFIIITYFVANAYNVFIYMATAVIMICYALVGAYLLKIGIKEGSIKNILIGLSLLHQILLFIKAKKESRQAISVKEWAGMFIVALLGVLAILVLICGAKSGTALDLRGLLGY